MYGSLSMAMLNYHRVATLEAFFAHRSQNRRIATSQGHPNAPGHWAFHGHRLGEGGAREVFPGHGCGAQHPRLCLGLRE